MLSQCLISGTFFNVRVNLKVICTKREDWTFTSLMLMERSGRTVPNDRVQSDMFSRAWGGVQNSCHTQETANQTNLKFFLNIKSIDIPEAKTGPEHTDANDEQQHGAMAQNLECYH